MIHRGPGWFTLEVMLEMGVGDKIVQVSTHKVTDLEGEIYIGAQVVDPEMPDPVSLGGRLALRKEDIGLKALGV